MVLGLAPLSRGVFAQGAGPESPALKLGYIALTDAAPLIIAKEKGLFDKHGLTGVEVLKQASWGALRDNLAMFKTSGVELIGISVDSKASLRAWAEQEGYDFTLLADFWPHGAVAKEYGVFLEEKGFANRATFVIDVKGVIRASFITAPGEARSIEEYRSALDEVLPTHV